MKVKVKCQIQVKYMSPYTDGIISTYEILDILKCNLHDKYIFNQDKFEINIQISK